MIKPLEKYYKEFIELRTDEACNFIYNSNREFQELSIELINKMNELSSGLPLEKKLQLHAYETKKNEKILLLIELIYYQGLQDGLDIKK